MAGSDPITAVGNLITTAIDKIFPDANQKAQALASFAALRETNDFQLMLANLQINLADAQSKSLFQAGWRPALAWSCVIAFIHHFLLFPYLVLIFPTLKDITPADFAIMMSVLTILIGARSVDKWQGTDTK